MKGRLRSYHVDHSTGKVAPAYWDAIGADGKTNLPPIRKRLLQKTPKRDRKALSLTRCANGSTTTSSLRSARRSRGAGKRRPEMPPGRPSPTAPSMRRTRPPPTVKAKLRVAMQPDPRHRSSPSLYVGGPEAPRVRPLVPRAETRGRVTENASA